ncbi:hypothetical protein DB345_06985 [Spartobacteria bacterium LR76]|nr:hypothetical protein DB345_06985 [Spartobacteria bacterium LR76]
MPFVRTELQIMDVLAARRIPVTRLRAAECTCRLVECVTENADGTFRCERCVLEQAVVRRTASNAREDNLSNYADFEDYSRAEELVKNDSLDELLGICVDGVPVGRMCLYDIVLEHKVNEYSMLGEGEVFGSYKRLVRAALILSWRFARFLQRNEVAGLLTYNSNYSLNNVISSLAQKAGIQTYSMHGGLSHRRVWETLMFTSGAFYSFWGACVKNWQNGFSRRLLDREEVLEVGEHFMELFVGKASHAYSAPVDEVDVAPLLQRASLGGTRKVIVAATSSADEIFAAGSAGIADFSTDKFVFPSLIDWIEFLIEHFRARPDLALIIRVHPREFPNKREGVTSAQAKKLLAVLDKVPENVFVNWPSENISLYQLIAEADLVLSCWSSALLEASAFGCPIVMPANPVNSYWPIADKYCLDGDSYWKGILEALDMDWTLERARQTFRWIWLLQFGSTISLRGRKRRNASLFELICEAVGKIKRSPRLHWHFRNELVTHDAFHGQYNQIVSRASDLEGADVLVEILTGNPQLASDSREVLRLQGKRHYSIEEKSKNSEEADAMNEMLAKFAEQLGLMKGGRLLAGGGRFKELVKRILSSYGGSPEAGI